MSVLDNPMHEKFAQCLAKGMSNRESFIAAGFSGEAALGNHSATYSDQAASKLKKKVTPRVREIVRAGAKRAEITVENVLLELAKIGFANIDDFIEVDPHSGVPLTNFKKSNRDQRAAISEVTVEEFVVGRGDDAREVRKTKFKLADKRAALVDLGKHLGAFASDAGSDTTITIRVEGGLPVVPPASKSSDD